MKYISLSVDIYRTSPIHLNPPVPYIWLVTHYLDLSSPNQHLIDRTKFQLFFSFLIILFTQMYIRHNAEENICHYLRYNNKCVGLSTLCWTRFTYSIITITRNLSWRIALLISISKKFSISAFNNVVGIYIMNWKWLVFIMHCLGSAGIFFNTCKSSFFHALLSLSRGLFSFFICSYFTLFLSHTPIHYIFVLYPSHSLSLSLCFCQNATGAVTRAADPCVVTVCSAWRDTSCRMAFVCLDAHWGSTRMLRDVWVSHQ